MPPQKEDPKGLYATLGLGASASEAEIRRAYRALALRWHPDKNRDNPDATAQFQKISAAYEVLSDTEKRAFYDRTGCIEGEDDDVFNEKHFRDLFAGFFGSFGADLGADEQLDLDDLLRGGFSFNLGGGRKRRGKKGAASAESVFFGQVFQEFFGSPGPRIVVKCPKGHSLKRKKADGDYECDCCGKDIASGKKLWECRRCDWCLCVKCHKAKKAELERQAWEEEDEEDEQDSEAADSETERLVEEILGSKVEAVRQGNCLRFRCTFSGETFDTEEEVYRHMVQHHSDEIEAAIQERVAQMC